MNSVDLVELVQATGAVDVDGLDVDAARRVLVDVGVVSRWADQLRVRVLARLEVLVESTPTMCPEAVNTATSLRTAREAQRDARRAAIVAGSPAMGDGRWARCSVPATCRSIISTSSPQRHAPSNLATPPVVE